MDTLINIVISLFSGALAGSFVSYKIVKKNNFKAKAGDGSEINQAGGDITK